MEGGKGGEEKTLAGSDDSPLLSEREKGTDVGTDRGESVCAGAGIPKRDEASLPVGLSGWKVVLGSG